MQYKNKGVWGGGSFPHQKKERRTLHTYDGVYCTEQSLMTHSKTAILSVLFVAFFIFSPSAFAQTATETVSLIRQDCTGYTSCYTSLSAWEAARQRDLVAANQIEVARIEGTWTNADTAPLSISGWTTDATRYIRIYTAPEARHAGVWDTGRYRISSAVSLGGHSNSAEQRYSRWTAG